MNIKANYVYVFIAFFSLLILSSCGTTKGPETRPVEDIFKEAVKLFDDEDYVESRVLFENIKLQYPASQFADDAQYYIAEISFKREEYIMAVFHYNLLRRIYPGSEYSKICLYKAALCYFKVSPSFERDQEYTKKAIESFQEFQYLYPTDSLYKESTGKIMELRDKLAYREYFTAGLYIKMDSPNSSLIYYDAVINKFNDSKYYEPAFIGKIEAFLIMKKYDKAKDMIYLFKTNFPKSENLSKMDLYMEQINNAPLKNK